MEISCKSSPQRLIRLMLLRSPAPKVLEPLALDKTVVVVNLVIGVKEVNREFGGFFDHISIKSLRLKIERKRYLLLHLLHRPKRHPSLLLLPNGLVMPDPRVHVLVAFRPEMHA